MDAIKACKTLSGHKALGIVLEMALKEKKAKESVAPRPSGMAGGILQNNLFKRLQSNVRYKVGKLTQEMKLMNTLVSQKDLILVHLV